MHIIEEMQYIQKWSQSLLDICDKLEEVLNSWDEPFPTQSSLNSHKITVDYEPTLLEITSTVFNNNWDSSKYSDAIKNVEFNEDAYQLIETLAMLTNKLEDTIGKLPKNREWKSIRYNLLMYKLLAKRGLELSALNKE